MGGFRDEEFSTDFISLRDYLCFHSMRRIGRIQEKRYRGDNVIFSA